MEEQIKKKDNLIHEQTKKIERLEEICFYLYNLKKKSKNIEEIFENIQQKKSKIVEEEVKVTYPDKFLPFKGVFGTFFA